MDVTKIQHQMPEGTKGKDVSTMHQEMQTAHGQTQDSSHGNKMAGGTGGKGGC